MRNALILGAVLGLCGCISRIETAPPTPDDLRIEPVEITSKAGAEAYIRSLGDEAERASGRASEFADWQPWFDEWSGRNAAARKNVFKPYENSLNARVGGKYDAKSKQWTFGPYDAAKASEAAKEAAKGYRKVVP